ncbi:hypothetical protein GALMADRAFT_259120 [Galerina marginata CBS 339.88]|uniref:Uncharacterized protein n=1 Tax=Galerina marginata (strain CBS 339.88) TaxID=685588 RepID=A0A067SIL6_GALM3|nr:hypothetical protein GALMADRAFT_259120 [Galerina marginata CBS 339.88]
MNSTCIPLTTNQDITGIGIRVSIYIQTILIVIASPMVSDEANRKMALGMIKTLFVTAFGVVLAAIIQFKAANGLSLVDQFVVILLVLLMNLSGLYNLVFLISVGTQYKTALLMNSIYLVFFSTFGILVWSNRSNLLGNPGDCPAKFVLFGRNIAPSSKGMRVVALIISVGSLLGPISIVELAKVLNDGEPITTNTEESMLVSVRKTTFKDLIWGALAVTPGLGLWIYYTVTTEMILLRNGIDKQTQVWSFGQTVAIILLLPQFLEFFSMINNSWDWLRTRRSRNKNFIEPNGTVDVKASRTHDREIDGISEEVTALREDKKVLLTRLAELESELAHVSEKAAMFGEESRDQSKLCHCTNSTPSTSGQTGH